MKSYGRSPSAFRVYGALVFVQILFGINYVVTKVVVEAVPPMVWASFRIILASGFMVLVATVLNRPHPKVGKEFFIPLIALSLLGTVINQICFLKGLQLTTPTNSAVLSTLIPVFTLLVVIARGQERASWSRGLGFLFALGGVLTLRKLGDFRLSDKTFIGDLLTIANCLSYAIFLSYGKSFLEKYDRTWVTTWLFIYGSIGITLVAAPELAKFEWPTLTSTLIVFAAYAIFAGTMTTYFLNNWALAYAKPSHVALMIYLQPSIAAGFAWLWSGTPITLRVMASTGLIFLGLLLALREPSSVKGTV